MSVKAKIKSALGSKNMERIQVAKGYAKYLKTCLPGHVSRFVMQSDEWEKPTVFEKTGRHLFFGYYDIQQMNKAQDKLLITEIPQKADTSKDKAVLQWIDVFTKEYHVIATSSAWCWQQGARLRWYPTQKDAVLFNDVDGGTYVTRIYDLQSGKQVGVLPRALYDITPDGVYGLSLNYSRLQRLRPGYGYNTLPDQTCGEKVPANDGIYRVDILTGKTNLIISLEMLSKFSPGSENEWNYINHISISPDGERFIFFHLWTPSITSHWHAKLYTAKMDGSELRCLEDEHITSHYCWKNSNELLTTSVGFGGTDSHYFTYNIASGERRMLQSQHLKHDGHPTYLEDKVHFVTDTYPLKNCLQHVFVESADSDDFSPLCDIYSDPRMFGEKRCDLHPRITSDGRFLTTDTTYKGGKRCVLMFKHK
ncbi:hypothetical protein [Desulfosporosinus nitroreducens]|uniref:Uncharacterized protein n=1 Tax=Desulfosporosinus nitroreducens TaxID=2018668 RepID=A0ABT8QWB0_9FIRM|nr:hypothetical protein [Desulfosporosinus nitroreducens]MDO0824925.1 hypothetical protein [Desulfosporosinus nitroreducens]